MNPLKINETTTLENGDVVKCVETTGMKRNAPCFNDICYFGKTCDYIERPRFQCLSYERPDGMDVHFVKNISHLRENIEKKE